MTGGPAELVIGVPERAVRAEELREGALRVRSRHGLRPVERALIEALPTDSPGRLLTGHDSEAAVARAAALLWGEAARITWWHLDAYVGARARAALEGTPVERLVAPDLPGVEVPGEPPPVPAEPVDLVALPFPRGQEAILGRELIEEAHAALRPGGRLLAATDEKNGAWLKKVLRDVFGNSTVAHALPRRQGMALMARRTRERAEVRDHRHVTRVTLRGRELELTSRPGVFGHARFDAGTRALAEACQVGETDVVLDLGCGYGGLALAVAPEVARVVGVDSNTRAVAMAARNANLAGLAGVEVLLREDLEALGVEGVDVVLANPPYFAGFRIARSFLAAAAAHLRPGGRLWLVAKAAAEHRELVEELPFRDVTLERAPSGHGIITGVRI